MKHKIRNLSPSSIHEERGWKIEYNSRTMCKFNYEEEGMKKIVSAVIVCVVLIGSFAVAASADVKPEVLVKQREAAMTLLGKYFGPLVAMAQDKAPFNGEVVAQNAAYISVLAKMPWDGFHESTSSEKSAALPAVFKDPAKFKKASEDMQDAVGKLVAVSKGADAAATKAAIGAVGKACGGCHDNFREKKQ
jgi:cytochrome c556